MQSEAKINPDSFRFAGLMVFGAGILILFAAEIAELENLSKTAIWIILTAFPIHGLYRLGRFFFVVKNNGASGEEISTATSIVDKTLDD